MQTGGVSLAVAIALGASSSACVTTSTSPRGEPAAAAPTPADEPLAQASPKLGPVLGFDVVAPARDATFLEAYATATQLPHDINADGELRVGPMLSRFEARWLAGVVAGGRVEDHDAFDEAASPTPIRELPSARGRELVFAAMRTTQGRRFVLAGFRAEEGPPELEGPATPASAPGASGAKAPAEAPKDAPRPVPEADPRAEERWLDRELYELSAGGPRLVGRLPSESMDGATGGTWLATLGGEPTVLSALGKEHDAEGHVDRLLGWRFSGNGGKDVVVEQPLFVVKRVAEGRLELAVTRVAPAPEALSLTTFELALRVEDVARTAPLVPNAWTNPRWSGVTPPPALVTLESSKTSRERTISLEPIE